MKSPFRSADSLSLLAALIVAIAVGPQVEAQAKTRSSKKKERGVVESLLVAPPKDREVCFSPDEPCDVKLAKFVLSAEKSIDVAIYDINLAPLVQHLLDSAKRGVSLRIVVDKRQALTEKSLVPKLLEAGASVRIGKQRGIMHNKFVIIDGKMIETGSFNFTNGAAFSNNENQIYLAEPSIVKRYRERFETLWDRGSDAATKLKRTGSSSKRRDD